MLVLSKVNRLREKYSLLCGEHSLYRDEIFLGILINVSSALGFTNEQQTSLYRVRGMLSSEGQHNVSDLMDVIRAQKVMRKYIGKTKLILQKYQKA